MSFTPGIKLGPYEIVSPIGKGGMGEVYRARDNKLGRDVAIKVLPQEFSQHPEKLARFEREAKLLAALNHPGIATLHGLEESEGKPFLVMELVEGQTLADRISAGPIPVGEALEISQQIAEALEAAHEKGVIHRDLKPANIKVDPEGKVKVLDFGLAKAFAEETSESELSQSPTLSRDATQAGVILGTAAYMSPEQARGKKVDKRSDIFSFGMVLYEMLTGNRTFTGEDVSDVLASIMKLEPDWKALPKDVPPTLTKLLRRCLTKDRKKRLQAIGDARNEIEDILADPSLQVASAPAQPSRQILPWALMGIAIVAFLTALWRPWQSEVPSEPVRLSVALGAVDRSLAPIPVGGAPRAVLSPDGTTLVYGAIGGGTLQLYIRSLDTLAATLLGGTLGGYLPFFSPDGQRLAFFAQNNLKTLSVSGGTALTLARTSLALGGTWGPDDTIVYAPSAASGLYRVPASGGAPVELTTLREGELSHRFPWFLPNGKAVLFSVIAQSADSSAATVESVLLETGERKVLHRGGNCPRYASSGHLLFAREGTVFAAPFDADRIEVTGESTPVLEGVAFAAAGTDFATADNGSLVYVPGGSDDQEVPRELLRVDREGNATLLAEARGDWETPRFSPDGQRLAVRRGEALQDVWILELSRGTLQRLTFEAFNLRPLWSPDGQTIFFSSNRTSQWNIFSKAADGSGPAEQLTEGVMRVPASITSDGKTLIFRQGGDADELNLDIGMLPLEGDGEPEMLLETSFNEHTPKLSPDDRWLAYVSNESGRDEVYVTRFPRGGKWQISTEGGKEPMWSRDSRELFYRNGQKMMVVDVSSGADQAGAPRMLFEGDYDLKIGSGASNYDVTPDGQGFVMIRTPENQGSAGIDHVTLVQNWFQELERLVPASD